MPVAFSRRQFLARCGVLGAALAVQPPAMARASRPAALAALRPLTVDALSGLAAFVVPGPDRYSRAQGVTDARPGGVAARAPEGMLELLDAFLPVPDALVQAMAAGFATGMSDAPIPALEPLLRGTEQSAATLDRALQAVLASDETVPLSLLVALMLNFVASSVDPAATLGTIAAAPFANLAYHEKAEVFRRIEEDHSELVALLDRGAPEPMRGSMSGQLEFLGGALPGVTALFSYGEWGVLDRQRGTVTGRPVGWDLSRYNVGRTTPADGWPEFRGYYRGVTRAGVRRRRRSDA